MLKQISHFSLETWRNDGQASVETKERIDSKNDGFSQKYLCRNTLGLTWTMFRLSRLSIGLLKSLDCLSLT
jgi:hypothetical protein